jgi:menaquinone-dependent protoporphyrinogen oxidase
MSIIVAYASEHGSTREIAEHIAGRISLHVPVQCVPVGQVKSLAGFKAVVVGSAVHGQHWRPSATAFIKNYVGQLGSMPVFAFSVGCPDAAPLRIRAKLRQSEEAKLAEFVKKEMNADSHAFFEGKLEKKDLSIPLRLIIGCCGWRDVRDIPEEEWDKMNQWCNEIVEKLHD